MRLPFLKKRYPILSFEEFVEDISNMTDKYMLESEKESGIVFAGGECAISRNRDDPNRIIVNITIYAKDQNDKWQKCTIRHFRKIKYFKKDEQTIRSLEKLFDESKKLDVIPIKKDD